MAKNNDKKLIYKKILKYIAELKRMDISVYAAYLFGSYIKGYANEWSDIDVAIVTDKFIGDSLDFKFLLMKIARTIDIDIEPHPYIKEEFTEDNPFVAEILKTAEQVA